MGCGAEPPGPPIGVNPPAPGSDASVPAPGPVMDAAAPAPDASAPSGGSAAPQPEDAAVPPPSGPTQVIAEPDDEAAYLYDQSQLRTYELRLTQADLDTLDANPAAEEYVPGTLVFEGREYPSVGIRYKGSAGAFIGCVGGGSIENPTGPKTCRKLSMKVAFDFTDPEGRFYGVRKLQFHSMRNDQSLMRERLGYALFREMGVAAPRAVHARLLINGRLEGLFALVEQIDGRFTRSRFTDGGEGNLYKEIWPMHDAAQAYLNALETNEDQLPSVARMQSFAAELDAAEGAGLVPLIDEYLGREAILNYLAVDRVIAHADGPLGFYCGLPAGQGNNPGPIGNHNYYWYEETLDQRFWMIPWDLDFTFSGRLFGGREAAWDEPVTEMACMCPTTGGGQSGGGGLRRVAAGCDKLVQGLAQLRDPYRERVRAFVEGPFRAGDVNAKLDAWTAQIAAAVKEQAQDPEQQPGESAWQSALNALRSSVDQLRGANVAQ